jgi:DNA-binding NarL/FixJ family response regulator
MHNEKGLIKKFISFGADGYLMKNSARQKVLDAIECVLNGQKYFSEEVLVSLEKLTRQDDSTNKLSLLTEREIEIVRLVANELTNKAIVEKLFISNRTVDTHRTNLMKKIEVTNVAGLIRFAFKNRIIQ